MYTVSDMELNDLEGYEALYQAVNSEYYPVLADLDNYAWEHIPEEMEIESFIHGAMCISYSGRCLRSNYFT